VKITLRFFATFRDFLPEQSQRSAVRLDIEPDKSVGAVLKSFQVPVEFPKIILINGRHAAENSLLAEGDIISVFPPLIGGLSPVQVEC
jgi:molybdopterin converting factor small subunit